jgi:type I restriction enzyme S subunit
MVNHYPKDWRIVLLSELSIEGFQNGLFYEVARKNKGIPIINVGDLYKSSPIANDKLELFNATAEEIKRYQVFNGDLFFTRSSIVPSGIAFCNWYRCSEKKAVVFDSHVVRFKTNTDVVNPMYLYLACIRPDARKYFLANAKTATMTTIDQTVLGRCPIPYPALKEQAAIAEAVSDADSLISSLQKLIEKKKAIKQGAMQELLTGKKRLPGFSGEWSKQQLGDICNIVNGGTPSTSIAEFWNGKILWCTPTDITSCSTKYIYTTESKITESGLKASSATLLPKGALLLCSRATIGEVRIAGNTICTNQGFKSLVVHQNISNEWLYYMVHVLKFNMLEKAIGSTFLEISKKDLAELDIIVPEFTEQKAIAQVLSDMDSEIELLEKKLAKYQQIKQGMMQELLTGRIRLV